MNVRAQILIIISLILSLFALLSQPCGAEDLPRQQKLTTIENLHQLSDKIYSGAQPEGEAAFRELKRLGIKTILSVDGAKPDVAAAKSQGLRYVHLPIGYDGMTAHRKLQIVKAAQVLQGPIFVHCHHGKHRGPAAAAICCRALDNWSSEKSLDWMRQTGTSPKYQGLYQVVREFQMPSAEELAKIPMNFPETAQVPSFVESMVAIDGHWEHLREFEKTGFRPSPDHPDITPAHEALQLTEQFRELARMEEVKQHDAKFRKLLGESENAAQQLHEQLVSLKQERTEKALQPSTQLMRRLEQDCAACHQGFRN